VVEGRTKTIELFWQKLETCIRELNDSHRISVKTAAGTDLALSVLAN